MKFHEIHEISGISTTPGGTLRVFPPGLRVLAIFAKFHPISWIGWATDSSGMGSGPTVHDPDFGRDQNRKVFQTTPAECPHLLETSRKFAPWRTDARPVSFPIVFAGPMLLHGR